MGKRGRSLLDCPATILRCRSTSAGDESRRRYGEGEQKITRESHVEKELRGTYAAFTMPLLLARPCARFCDRCNIGLPSVCSVLAIYLLACLLAVEYFWWRGAFEEAEKRARRGGKIRPCRAAPALPSLPPPPSAVSCLRRELRLIDMDLLGLGRHFGESGRCFQK